MTDTRFFSTAIARPPDVSSEPLRLRLKNAGIRHFDETIYTQSKDWLLNNFSEGATDYPVNVACLMRNIVWQIREQVQSGQREPLKELLRTFWYMFIKPTLARAGVLVQDVDQYAQLIDNIVSMVKILQVMKYADIGFRDDNEASRKIGGNTNLLLFAEKAGHQNFLFEVAAKYNVTAISLGGQPSLLSAEYFVDALRKSGVNLQRSFYLFGIVDYDPSGWIIRDAFLNDLAFYGIKNVRVHDLVNPDRLTADEVLLSRFPIPAGKAMDTKNADWLKKVHERQYQNQHYLEEDAKEGERFYGLESESISTKRFLEDLEASMVPLIGKSEDLLRVYELKVLDKAIKDLILHKI